MRSHVKVFAACLLVGILIGIFALSPAFSSLISSVLISNTGSVSENFTARSGSPQDIQAAVDQIRTLGGGTVYIPAGDFVFNPPANGVGVTVYSGVNLVGVGKGLTVLRETQECVNSIMIKANGMGTPQKPIRIQGISFIGYVPSRADADSVTNNGGLWVNCVKDFVVYDCHFENFVNWGILTDNNDGWAPPRYYSRGVISHCDFDQPYKYDQVIQNRIWGYGIVVGGNAGDGFANSPDYKQVYGHYDDLPNNCPMTYIEDCDFRRCRHSIAGAFGSGDYYVARHNTFIELFEPAYGSHVDQHPGGRGVEIYDNEIIGYPVSQYVGIPRQIGSYNDMGVGIRGGSALIYNNRIVDCSPAIQLYETVTGDQRVQGVFIWNNTITYPNRGSGQDLVVDQGISEYYLRPPDLIQDGFSYTSYPYPHPLVADLTH